MRYIDNKRRFPFLMLFLHSRGLSLELRRENCFSPPPAGTATRGLESSPRSHVLADSYCTRISPVSCTLAWRLSRSFKSIRAGGR